MVSGMAWRRGSKGKIVMRPSQNYQTTAFVEAKNAKQLSGVERNSADGDSFVVAEMRR